MTDILIIPITGTIDFTNNAGEVLRMSGSGDPQGQLELSGPSGSIASFKDSFEDVYFAVTDQSQLPVFEVLSDNRVKFFGPLVGKVYQSTNHVFLAGGTGLVYIPINSTAENATITTLQVGWLAPADGELVEVYARSTIAADSTIIGFHTNDNTSAIETDTVNMNATGKSFVFSFSSAVFLKGDKLHISFDPTNNPSVVHITCRWLHNWRT